MTHEKGLLVETIHVVCQLYKTAEVGDAVQATEERRLAHAVLAHEKGHLGQFGALFPGEAPDVLERQVCDDGAHALLPAKSLPKADCHR